MTYVELVRDRTNSIVVIQFYRKILVRPAACGEAIVCLPNGRTVAFGDRSVYSHDFTAVTQPPIVYAGAVVPIEIFPHQTFHVAMCVRMMLKIHPPPRTVFELIMTGALRCTSNELPEPTPPWKEQMPASARINCCHLSIRERRERSAKVLHYGNPTE